MNNRTWFIAFLGGFFSGVILRSFIDLGPAFIVFLVLLGVVLALWAYVGVDKAKRYQVAQVALFLIMAGLGALRFEMADNPPDPVLEAQAGESVTFEGLVVDETDVRENSSHLTVRVDEFKDKVLVITELYPEYSYGDRLRIEGDLQRPENFESDNGRVFDYVSYLGKDDIHFQSFYPQIELLSEGGGSFIKRWLFGFKHAFLDRVGVLIPEPHTSLLGGLLVGAKQSLGKDLLDDFRATGIIHIVVLSGYNITIIADFIGRFFSLFFSRYISVVFGVVGIILFALLTGGSATVARATLMALLVTLARVTGRRYDITRALFAAGSLMTLHNPKIVVFDPSFQLSFLATFALIFIAPHIEERLQWLPTKWKFREAATATVSTQLFVLPAILYMTGDFSVVALPVNLLVLLVIPATMLAGFLAGTLGFISSILVTPFAWAAYFLLAYELQVVEFFANLPFATFSVGMFPFWATLLLYGIIIALLVRFHHV